MITIRTPTRGLDTWGDGRYGAKRGKRQHRGIDFAAWPGSTVLSPVEGHVTKLGYPYADDLTYRYVQITDDRGYHHRFFYVDPEDTVELEDYIFEGDPIGTVQNLLRRYPRAKQGKKMTPHVHYEIKGPDGDFINPQTYTGA